jgi:hypothetical protein
MNCINLLFGQEYFEKKYTQPIDTIAKNELSSKILLSFDSDAGRAALVPKARLHRIQGVRAVSINCHSVM